MQEKRVHLARTGWTLTDQGVVSLGNFLLNVQLARALPASEYGVFALLFSVIFLFQHCSIAMLIYPMSLRVAAAGEGRATALMAATFTIVAAGVLAFACLLAGGLVLVGRPEIAVPTGVACFLWLMQDAMRRGLMAEFRHRTAIVGDAITYFGQAALVAVLVGRGQISLTAALYVLAAASAIGGLVQLKSLGLPWPRLAGAIEMVREFWMVGRWAVSSGLLLHLRLQLLPWGLGLVHGPAAAAGLQALMNIANLTNPLVFGLSNTISQSAAEARTKGGNEEAWRTSRTYVLFGAPLIILYAVLVFAVPVFVLQTFYGANSIYTSQDLALRLIMVAIVINYFVETYCAFLYGVDGGRTAFDIALTGLIVAVIAALLIVPAAVTGAAAAMLLANVARLVPSFRSRATVLAAGSTKSEG